LRLDNRYAFKRKRTKIAERTNKNYTAEQFVKTTFLIKKEMFLKIRIIQVKHQISMNWSLVIKLARIYSIFFEN